MKLAWLISVTLFSICLAQDATVDWLMKQSATAPATKPATQPVSPLETRATSPESSRHGKITLSDGSMHVGPISTTEAKPLRFYDTSIKEYRDVPLTLIASMDAKILWERDEPEWHFKESGSDLKEFTGKTYPARETEYVVTLTNGQTFTGGVVAPIYLTENGKAVQYVLYKRSKGAVGQKLSELIYVLKVELTE